MERIERARSSGNLQVSGIRRCDIDFLVAAGMASRNAVVGGALMRLRTAGGKRSVEAAVDAVKRVVKSMNARRRWRLRGRTMQTLTEAAVLHYMDPSIKVDNASKELVEVLRELDGIVSAMDRSIERLMR